MNLLALSTFALTLIIVAAVVVLAIIIFCVYISLRNTLVRLEAGCDESWSGIDIYLKKRYDLIPNLVETVKGYAKHESDTLEKVILARNAAVAAPDPNAKIEADNAVSGTLRQSFALTESYPALRADTQFLQLQQQLQTIENELSQARKFYNGKCKAYNIKLRTFPSSIAAGAMHLSPRKYFELESEEERKNVKVSF